MTDKPQTQKDMLVTLLDKVLVLTEKVVETQSQVVEINHTIHNGMSKAIQDTAKRVTSIEGDMGEVSVVLRKSGLRDTRNFWSGLARWKKAVVWVLGLGGALYAWAQLITYINGL